MSNTTAVLPFTMTRVTPRTPPSPRYVVELCQSARPIDPNSVPQLDLFPLYHLYADVRPQSGAGQHSLRLGFFKEPGTAKAIGRYLAPHFRGARVVQIDAAEIVRSLRRKFMPTKDVGDSGTCEVVELVAPPALPIKSHTVQADSSVARGIAARSLWSRLLERLNVPSKRRGCAGRA